MGSRPKPPTSGGVVKLPRLIWPLLCAEQDVKLNSFVYLTTRLVHIKDGRQLGGVHARFSKYINSKCLFPVPMSYELTQAEGKHVIDIIVQCLVA